MNSTDTQASVGAANAARTELYDTLAKLRDQLDYARRFDEAVERGKERIAREQVERPLRFAAGVAATSAVAGLAVWGVASVVVRRFVR